MVQCLRLHAFTEAGTGLIPGWGTKIPHAMQRGQPPPPPENILSMLTFNYFFHIFSFYTFYSYRSGFCCFL